MTKGYTDTEVDWHQSIRKGDEPAFLSFALETWSYNLCLKW